MGTHYVNREALALHRRKLPVACLGVGLTACAVLAVGLALWADLRVLRAGALRVVNRFYADESRGVSHVQMRRSDLQRVSDVRRRMGGVVSWDVLQVAAEPITDEWIATVSVKRTRGETREQISSFDCRTVGLFEVIWEHRLPR